MEKNKLVVRIKDPNDRRVVRVHLLEEGQRIIEEVIQKRQQYLKNVIKNYDLQEIIQLESSLMKLHLEMREE
jgi:DNA-binding MarR family transcriptional regulator